MWPAEHPEQDSVFPTANPSLQESCTSLLSEGRQNKQELQFYNLKNENHNHRKLTKMISQVTALCNSTKPWDTSLRATQAGQIMVESTDKAHFSGKGNGKPLQCFCLKNPINRMKRQKDMTSEDKPPRLIE